jgi:hypothetical protein
MASLMPWAGRGQADRIHRHLPLPGPGQVAPAASANRIVRQLGGVLGTVALALVLQHSATGQAGPAAFGATFAWALGLTVIAVIPALTLPRRP